MATSSVRVTAHVARVLRQFLGEEGAPQYGFDLMKATHLRSGIVYPVLARLERAGWIARNVQPQGDVVPAREGSWRPPRLPRHERRLLPRTYYLLTPEGAQRARAEMAALSEQFAPPH